jgi:heme/copper-type cytochrome/quinol oxidase subunit 4
MEESVSIAFRIKNFLRAKGLMVHWQYLVLAVSLSIATGFLWALASILTRAELLFIPVIVALIQGFLAFLYMPAKGEARYVFYAIVFSLFAYFLGKYLLYIHYYDWMISAVVDKSKVDSGLLFFYLRTSDYESFKAFLHFFKSNASVFDWLTILSSIAGRSRTSARCRGPP